MSAWARLILPCSVASVVACSIGETTYETVELPVRARRETRTCDSPFARPDIATLAPCGEGKGHCFDRTKVPVADTELPDCGAKEVCVPDAILRAGGEKLRSCTFFIGGKPGACVSMLLADIGAHANELKQDVCADDERCAPCVNPVDGTDTHLCDPIGVHEGACVGGTEADQTESCCHGMGVCMNEDSVPEDSREDMVRETCPSAKVCAPAAMVNGAPVPCDILGAPGVCLDLCFAAMLRGTKAMIRAGCGPTEICMPCAIGAGQGMPGC
jgi:hypothetical protein